MQKLGSKSLKAEEVGYMKRKWLKNVLKGLWVGSTMTVPGVSGGTMAVVVGIYEELIHAINGLKDNIKIHMIFLLQFLLGAGTGFLVFARIITALLDNAIMGGLTRLFFCGVVIGGIPLLVRKSGIEKLAFRHIVSLCVGAVIVLGLLLLPTGMFVTGSGVTFWILQFIGGIIVAIALILPGISVTHILYIMGLYEVVLQRVYELQWLSLVPLAAGVLVGTFSTADILEKGIQKYPEEVYMAIIGFVASSLVNLIPTESLEMPVMGIGLAIAGFLGMYMLSKKAGEQI